MALGLLKRLFGRDEGRDALTPLYNAIVAEARSIRWYLDGKVADTMDGRFEMVAALTALAIARLDAEGEAGRLPAALLTEIFVDDMDGQLRQEGVGDIVVGKHIGRMMAALGGRLEAYQAGLAPDAAADLLEAALVRNLYRGDTPEDAALSFSATALRQFWGRLCTTPLDGLMAGTLA